VHRYPHSFLDQPLWSWRPIDCQRRHLVWLVVLYRSAHTDDL